MKKEWADILMGEKDPSPFEAEFVGDLTPRFFNAKKGVFDELWFPKNPLAVTTSASTSVGTTVSIADMKFAEERLKLMERPRDHGKSVFLPEITGKGHSFMITDDVANHTSKSIHYSSVTGDFEVSEGTDTQRPLVISWGAGDGWSNLSSAS